MEWRVVILWWKKLRKNTSVNVEGIRNWACSVGKLLLAMDALLTWSKWAGNNLQKVRELWKNIRRKGRHTIKNIIREK